MGKVSNRQSSTARGAEHSAPPPHFTAGDLARLLDVDLKTIHNWVNQGHVLARRTEGRHLRFQRVEVVRFLRRFGYPVPDGLGTARPRVLVHSHRTWARIPNVEQFVADGLLATILELALGAYEVVVLSLDLHEIGVTREVVQVLRARPETRCLSLVGLSRRPLRRTDFVKSGGDLALAPGKATDVAHAVRFLTGSAEMPPRGALTA